MNEKYLNAIYREATEESGDPIRFIRSSMVYPIETIANPQVANIKNSDFDLWRKIIENAYYSMIRIPIDKNLEKSNDIIKYEFTIECFQRGLPFFDFYCYKYNTSYLIKLFKDSYLNKDIDSANTLQKESFNMLSEELEISMQKTNQSEINFYSLSKKIALSFLAMSQIFYPWLFDKKPYTMCNDKEDALWNATSNISIIIHRSLGRPVENIEITPAYYREDIWQLNKIVELLEKNEIVTEYKKPLGNFH